MYICVDFDRIKQHQSLLQDELKIATQLSEQLTAQLLTCLPSEYESLLRQRNWAEKQERWIRQRISLLNSIIDELSAAKRRVQSEIEEAYQSVKKADQ